MAKLFKIQSYIVDYNDEFDSDNIAEYLDYCTQRHFSLQHTKIAEADLGEFYDEHPLNYVNCPEAEFEKYFKENNQC
jgi:hypothetical protein